MKRIELINNYTSIHSIYGHQVVYFDAARSMLRCRNQEVYSIKFKWIISAQTGRYLHIIGMGCRELLKRSHLSNG